MTLSRRDFLRLSGLVAAGAAASACAPVYRQLGVSHPIGSWTFPSGDSFRALNRITFGANTAERSRLQSLNVKDWIEDQLAFESINDSLNEIRWRRFDTLKMKANELSAHSDKPFGYYDKPLVLNELRQATLVRQVYSARQLYEVMVEFWNDHFNISVDKGNCWYLKTVDDRDVIRAHALGSFRDLLWASAHSPAMMIYLDNQANRKGAPNENYARELMELHTLGVDGGYTQHDVMELARCFTGWTVKEHWWKGDFTFNDKSHDTGAKTVLGLRLTNEGQREAERVIEVLASHPRTARFIATKLARRFIADLPPHALIEKAAQAFLKTNGDIKSVLRVILLDGLAQAQPKFKRPLNFIVSALRMLKAETDGGNDLQGYFLQMGQPYFGWATPDGYPDRSEPWQGNLMPRWQFAFALARNELKSTQIDVEAILKASGAKNPIEMIDSLSALLLGTTLDSSKRDEIADVLKDSKASEVEVARIVIGGLIASPAFQWR